MGQLEQLAADVQNIMLQQRKIIDFIESLKPQSDDQFVTVDYMARNIGVSKSTFQNRYMRQLNFLKRVGTKGAYRAKLSDFNNWKDSL